MFFEKATNHYLTAFDPSAGVTKELAKSLVEDGNDPSVFQSFNMKQGDVAALEAKGVGIMAAGGHFFTVRKVHGQWTSFDSANHPAPKPYGSLAQLMKAEARNGQIWVGA
ncbi:hypothetical protein D187_007650 [Cystobacter fuscus DSM 2262]|uniref:Uncharacterized protein n=2 Tax=Cystobacter fuscus TaxID=43 RepID=S9QIK7_CYSF2|nr:hypothetical protein D187_007650 [Cystobacter fuscus DSM 2262]